MRSRKSTSKRRKPNSALTVAHHMKWTAGTHRIAAVLLNPSHDSKESDDEEGNSQSRDREFRNRRAAANRADAERIVSPDRHPPAGRRCEAGSKSRRGRAGRLCAEDLRHFADRAFRRPVKDDELDRLMAIWRRADGRCDGEKDPGPFDRSLARADRSGAGVARVFVPRRNRSRYESDGAAPHQRLRIGLAIVVFSLEQHARRRSVRLGPSR